MSRDFASAHIHIQGQVQGVGFRPHVFKLAISLQLTGWVNNTVDGVHIEVSGTESRIEEFYESLISSPPKRSIIIGHHLRQVPNQTFDGFNIMQSKAAGQPNLLLTPDFGMCPDCARELRDSQNSRFNYPFITCTHCGPRFSIITGLPYDRPVTTMDSFTMCDRCQAEYEDPINRRHFSQTNSCPNCPVTMSLKDSSGIVSTDNSDIIRLASSRVRNGEILAIKGIGGYLLVCDATNGETISTLRYRKHRPTKPFAMIYPTRGDLLKDVQMAPEEDQMMNGPESPILLLRMNQPTSSSVKTEFVAPGQNYLGVMRAYAPVLQLLVQAIDRPVIATSANLSESPILYNDHEANEKLLGLADLIVANNRSIVIPQDDSVIRFTDHQLQKIILRRSRGLAPSIIGPSFDEIHNNVLSLGADLKATFGIVSQGACYISQYLGDLGSYHTVEAFEHTLRHISKLVNFKPEVVLVDKHPDYYSRQLGVKLANELGAELISYQHHQAHFSAVLADNQLLRTPEPILGVIWDGTGWGDDGQIWGGEFMTYDNGHFARIGHLDYFPHILGDKMSREPRISALALAYNHPNLRKLLKPKFAKTEWTLYTNRLEKPNRLSTSSMGRMFDAVASLVGLIDRASFEGEAAMLLENTSSKYRNDHRAYPYQCPNPDTWKSDLLAQIERDLLTGVPPGLVGMKFHLTLVEWIKLHAKGNFKKLAFTGGVFQNALLVDLIIEKLDQDYQLFFHKSVSPNDEGISLGQLANYQIDQLVEVQSVRIEGKENNYIPTCV